MLNDAYIHNAEQLQTSTNHLALTDWHSSFHDLPLGDAAAPCAAQLPARDGLEVAWRSLHGHEAGHGGMPQGPVEGAAAEPVAKVSLRGIEPA